MLKFIIDTQLPPKLAKFLCDKGFSAIHTTYFPNGHLLDDKFIIQIAIHEDRIIITKDSDFLDNFLIHGVPPKVLMLQFGNISNAELLSLFDHYLLMKLFKHSLMGMILSLSTALIFLLIELEDRRKISLSALKLMPITIHHTFF